ncbi:MAG: hypothetical protein E4H02_06865 [Lentisphaerales bacterium]|jgi:hypothetical protein|nr:MAG: hypothetical protein E4H02_06865 [Lentisphaerales bacterium]
MRPLKITVFMVAVFVLTIQGFRHVYVRFLETRTSVLERYEVGDTEKVVNSVPSLAELVEQYEVAKKTVDELEEQRREGAASRSEANWLVFEETFREEHKQAYELESSLKKGIREWEGKSKEINDLRVFWLLGFALVVIGELFEISGRAWIGMSLIIPGLAEMIWWTSPSFGLAGGPHEFNRMLINKLVLTLITLVLVMIGWYLNEKREKRRGAATN